MNLAGPAAVLSCLIAGAVMCLCALSFIVVSTRAGERDSGYGPIGSILLIGLGGLLYRARHYQRDGTGRDGAPGRSRAGADEQIDGLDTPLMRAARRR